MYNMYILVCILYVYSQINQHTIEHNQNKLNCTKNKRLTKTKRLPHPNLPREELYIVHIYIYIY